MFSLADIWSFIIFAIFFVHRRIYPPTSVSRIATSTSDSGRSIRLPNEILDHIFSLYIVLLVDGLQCGTVRDYRVGQMRLMKEISAVTDCSSQLNRVMLGSLRRMWASCGLGLCSLKEDSNTTDRLARSVWIITAEQGCLPLDINLAVYKILEIASINYHNGVQWSKQQRGFRRFRCVSAYPRSLRQLEILRLHTPEEEVIGLVSDCCPGLTELRLVRCTMFNDPKCWYWRAHTRHQDHDYMRTHDPAAVIDYANHMAFLLRRLPQLESIHIGHYLISINAVFTHRVDGMHKQYHTIIDKTSHVDSIKIVNNARLEANADDGPPVDWRTMRLADRELWADLCPQCEREFRKPIETAERLAARILAAHFKSLKHVSFASFLSGGRVSPSSWLVGRQQRDLDLYVWTEDPDRPRSREMRELVQVGNRWEPRQ